MYSPGEIEEVMRWAQGAGIHVVFDEIYALSVFAERSFTSCAHVAAGLGDSVHIVWAFSKDFGASGLRCGVLISENEALLRAVDSLAYWACTSGHTQYLLGEVISDQAWVDGYIAQVKEALGNAYRSTTAALEKAGIPYLPAEAGFFFLCDLRQFLNEPSWQAEDTLWHLVLEEGNINLTPGTACRNAEPGFLRLCFAGVPTETVVTAVQRMGAVLARINRP
jgi:1-aminocyclopropane-1-carboxylate synthase